MDRKHGAVIALALAIVTLAALGPHTSTVRAVPLAQAQPGGIAPDAGRWSTWVLASGSELRLPPPPDAAATRMEMDELRALVRQRDEAGLAQIRFWDAGSPSYRWVEIGLAQITQRSLTGPRATRLMALINVAVYDAMIAAWDSKYAHNRSRPSGADPTLGAALATPASPSYPSEHAVAAGAASAVLAALFPDEAATFQAKAKEATRSRLLAGVHYPSDVSAGLELGKAVAARVLEHGRRDGSDAQWTGSVPQGPCFWNGMNPQEPLAGTWRPWVLASGDQLRPGPPVPCDSTEKAVELAAIRDFQRTFTTNSRAFFWQTFEGIYDHWYNTGSRRLFEYRLDENAPLAARAYALLSVTHFDAMIARWDAKYAYWAIRPFQLDPAVTTLFPTPGHPSYPAAHGCFSGAIAEMLAYLFPQDAAGIRASADEAATSRLRAGIHFPSDIESGLALGRAVARLVIERARVEGSR